MYIQLQHPRTKYSDLFLEVDERVTQKFDRDQEGDHPDYIIYKKHAKSTASAVWKSDNFRSPTSDPVGTRSVTA